MYKLRRTMMFLPGNNPAMVKDAHIYGADSIMFDLEDAISVYEKDAARLLVYNALKTIDYEGTETVVRINGLDTPYWREDLEAIVRAKPDVIRIPKTQTARDVEKVEKVVEEVERKAGIPVGTTKLMAAIESAMGVINAYEIASSSKRLMGIALSAEDFVTDMKTTRSLEGTELLLAREKIVLAARAAGIYALDTVFSDVNDDEGLANEVRLIKQMGFDGKSIINPRQIAIVNKIYTPTQKEIEKSLRVIHASEDAKKKGLGVVSLNGKMVDKPIIERARRVLTLAKASGLSIDEGGEELV
ncbi:MAG TPA: citrate (pro-3S)-lyase subunit beta [Clostridiaceae bacterium]|nr:citrate (pro-3S)-lyase subunit beta [Clostridiaceae bacterium]